MIQTFRDPISGLTHCIGAVLAIVGTIFLILRATEPVMVWQIATFSIFGGGMVLLYTASTLYHWLPLSDAGLRLFRRIDHSMIYFYIAATYTPICLIGLGGAWGWSIFAAVWTFGVTGIFLKVFWMTAPRWFSTGLYLAMGWLVIVGIYPLALSIETAALVWLVMGGVLYSIGAVIYAVKWPDPLPNKFGFHEIFHLFVMAGSACHYIMIYCYIGR